MIKNSRKIGISLKWLEMKNQTLNKNIRIFQKSQISKRSERISRKYKNYQNFPKIANFSKKSQIFSKISKKKFKTLKKFRNI